MSIELKYMQIEMKLAVWTLNWNLEFEVKLATFNLEVEQGQGAKNKKGKEIKQH